MVTAVARKAAASRKGAKGCGGGSWPSASSTLLAFGNLCGTVTGEHDLRGDGGRRSREGA